MVHTPSEFIDMILDEIYHPINTPGGGLYLRKDRKGRQYIIDDYGKVVIDSKGFHCDCCPKPIKIQL